MGAHHLNTSGSVQNNGPKRLTLTQARDQNHHVIDMIGGDFTIFPKKEDFYEFLQEIQDVYSSRGAKPRQQA